MTRPDNQRCGNCMNYKQADAPLRLPNGIYTGWCTLRNKIEQKADVPTTMEGWCDQWKAELEIPPFLELGPEEPEETSEPVEQELPSDPRIAELQTLADELMQLIQETERDVLRTQGSILGLKYIHSGVIKRIADLMG